MSIIYCDEAGNSGENLLDKDQPFFVLASNDYGRSEARALLSHVRSAQGGEPKFRTLKKTADGIRRLTRFFSDPSLDKSRVVVDIYHKRFMVVTKLVDLIAETLFHEMGEDLYRRGANIAMSNMLYHCMPVFCGDQVTEHFLRTFVDLIRWRSEDHAKAFFVAGSAMIAASSDEDFKADLGPLANPLLFHVWFDDIGENVLDPAIPALFQHIAVWGHRKTERFRIIHDKSKPVLASQENFENMMALSNEPSAFVGYDRRKFKFPLRAESLGQGDSVEYPQLQIADLCAGAINHYFKCKHAGQLDELATIIGELKCLDWGIGAVGPSTNITPEELGTTAEDGGNPIDPIAAYVFRRRRTSRSKKE